jgi:hypothetical protein
VGQLKTYVGQLLPGQDGRLAAFEHVGHQLHGNDRHCTISRFAQPSRVGKGGLFPFADLDERIASHVQLADR